MKEVKTPKRPLIYYYCIVLLMILLFNLLITPMLSRNQVVEVDYGTFMDMIEEKNIGAVQVVQHVQAGHLVRLPDGGQVHDLVFLQEHLAILGQLFCRLGIGVQAQLGQTVGNDGFHNGSSLSAVKSQ